jgi:hypothetical protein
MCHVMLHLMHLARKAFSGEGRGQMLRHARTVALVAQAIQHHTHIRPFRQRVRQLLAQVGFAVLVDRDMVAHEARSGIAVKGVDAQDNSHSSLKFSKLSRRFYCVERRASIEITPNADIND